MGLTPLVIIWARKRGLVDKPDVRKIHTKPVARVGGLVIFLGTILAISLMLCLPTGMGQMFGGHGLEMVVLLGTSICIFAVGLYDDLKHARVRTKLLVEVLATVVVITAGINIDTLCLRGAPPIHLGWFGYLLTFGWIIGITNAVNLIDGLDGLAAGISGLACAVIAILSVSQGNIILALVMLALLGSVTGFLCFNFHPARIFMGDCGSLFLGFVIATSSVLTAAKSEALVGMGLPVLVLGIPIFDTLLSMLRRFIERRGIMSPDRGHFHHRLLDMGFKQHQVAVIAYAVTAGVTGMGFFMVVTRSTASVTILLLCLTLLLLVFRVIGSVKLRDVMKGMDLRLDLGRRQRQDKRAFEEARIELRRAETFEQWWGCLCTTARRFDFACVCLKTAFVPNDTQDLSWESQDWARTRSGDLMQVSLPIRSRQLNPLHMEVQIRPNGSLESAGHRVALIARLVDECGLDDLRISEDCFAKPSQPLLPEHTDTAGGDESAAPQDDMVA